MPAVSLKGKMSTGHGAWPPTAMIATPVTKTYFNGILAGVKDPACQFADHTAPINQVHPANTRYPSVGASKTYIEGKKAARIGDLLADGDAIAEGSANSFIE
jgi:uncharacterized Zn-binding protein involved in type VI secretion